MLDKNRHEVSFFKENKCNFCMFDLLEVKIISFER